MRKAQIRDTWIPFSVRVFASLVNRLFWAGGSKSLDTHVGERVLATSIYWCRHIASLLAIFGGRLQVVSFIYVTRFPTGLEIERGDSEPKISSLTLATWCPFVFNFSLYTVRLLTSQVLLARVLRCYAPYLV